MRSYLFILLFLSIFFKLNAQQIPLNEAVQNRLNQLIITSDTSIFTGFRGMNWLELQQLNKLQKTDLIDSAFGISPSQSGGYFLKNLATDNWIKLGKNKSVVTVDPYVEFGIGKSNQKNNALVSGAGGLRVQAVINNKFSFDASWVDYSQQFPSYVDSLIYNKQNIVPGNNVATLYENQRWIYNNASFNFTYLPSKHFLISAGYGKQFLGDGYRSLQLSDNSFNYPYVRLQARFWKLTYNVLYNEYENKLWYLVNGRSQKKFSVMHELGINVSNKFQFALYDEVTSIAKDTSFNRGFDVTYLNPLIFIRPLEFSIGSPDNAMIGFHFKYNVYKKGFLYGQLALDDLALQLSLQNHAQHYANKYALQLGLWNNDLFGVKNLSWRLEWNGVRPYTYGHGVGNNVALNYSHYYQSLTDPLGANFHEFISYFNYNNKRWYGSLETMFAIRGEGDAKPGVPAGDNIFENQSSLGANGTYGSFTLQGSQHYFFYNQLSAGYLLNPKNRLSIEANAIYHRRTGEDVHQSEAIFSIGIKTGLFNTYFDY